VAVYFFLIMTVTGGSTSTSPTHRRFKGHLEVRKRAEPSITTTETAFTDVTENAVMFRDDEVPSKTGGCAGALPCFHLNFPNELDKG
jgi:hypothetical protein